MLGPSGKKPDAVNWANLTELYPPVSDIVHSGHIQLAAHISLTLLVCSHIDVDSLGYH